MARRALVNDLMYYGVIGGVLYVGYDLSLKGRFGSDLKDLAEQIKGVFAGTQPPPNDNGIKPPKWAPPTNCIGDVTEMVRQNINFGAQMFEWQKLRFARNEDPYDWQALRRHLTHPLFGAPDPGPNPPQAFCDWNPSQVPQG